MRALNILVGIMVLASVCGCEQLDVCSKLEEYVCMAYAPTSAEAFNAAKEEAVELGILTQADADQLFKTYGEVLTENDLNKTCIADCSYSDGSLYPDKRGRHMLSARIYTAKGAEPIELTFVFYDGGGYTIDFV